MRRDPVRSTTPALLLVAALSAPLAAQGDSLAVLSGRVVDEAGVGIAQAQVRISGTAHATIADSTGRFRITCIAPGTYNIRVAAIRHAPAEASGVRLAPGAETTLQFTLASAPYREPAPEIIRPVPGEAPGTEGLALRAFWDRSAAHLGWPNLRTAPPPAGVRELRVAWFHTGRYGPRILLRLVTAGGVTRGELREVWWHSPTPGGPYQVRESLFRTCANVDTVTTVCALADAGVDWDDVAVKVQELGVWQRFTDVGVVRRNHVVDHTLVLKAEAVLNGAYRSVSYDGPDFFPDDQTTALLGLTRLGDRLVADILRGRLGR